MKICCVVSRGVLCLGVLCAAAEYHLPALAQPAMDEAGSRKDLIEIRARIKNLEQSIGETEKAHAKELSGLEKAEKAVSRIRRELTQLARRKEDAEQKLDAVKQEQQQVQLRIDTRQAELAQWLRRNYIHSATDMAPLLSATDPNQLTRDMFYMGRLAEARAVQLAALHEDLTKQSTLVEEAAQQLEGIAALEQQQKQLVAKLAEEQKKRRLMLARLKTQLHDKKDEVSILHENEQRMELVLAEIEARRLEEQRRVAEETERQVESPSDGQQTKPAYSSPANIKSANFAAMRGQVIWPVQGGLTARFGEARTDGGAKWRGIFIGTQTGQKVVAVADGTVVYSDWLRGYGNLIILDHGDDYLTVYGNNDTLYKKVGEEVNRNEAIAEAGASGGGRDPGVYFEIRYQGTPQDPLLWTGRKQ